MTEDTKAILAEIARANDLTRGALRMILEQNALLQAMVEALSAGHEAYRETARALSALEQRLGDPEADRAPPGELQPFRARAPRHLN